MNNEKLLRNFEYSKSRDAKNFSAAVADPEEERRGPGPFSVFLKDKDSTHGFNNKGKTAWNVNLMIYFVDTCAAIAYLTILPPLSPDKDQSS